MIKSSATGRVIPKVYIMIVLVMLYFFMKPFYLWSSGNPQISDFIGCLIILITFIFYMKDQPISKLMIISAVLFIYILVVNSIWGIMLNEHFSFLQSSVWYLYNFLLMIAFAILLSRYSHQFLQVISRIVTVTIYTQFILLIIMPSSGGRGTGFFNNPNQLGYFALLYLCLYIVISKKLAINTLLFWLTSLAAFIVCLYSLSKAAIISSILILVVELFLINKGKKNKLMINSVILMIVVYLTIFSQEVVNIVSNSPLFESVEGRLQGVGKDSDDNLAGRGYDRIINHPDYLLFGAGEGAYGRLKSFGGEMHSTIGNFFFSYGVIGSILLFILLFTCILKNKLVDYYPLFFILLYGLTHNGIRNSILWIMFGLWFYLKKQDAATNKEQG